MICCEHFFVLKDACGIGTSKNIFTLFSCFPLSIKDKYKKAFAACLSLPESGFFGTVRDGMVYLKLS